MQREGVTKHSTHKTEGRLKADHPRLPSPSPPCTLSAYQPTCVRDAS
jgi:hypothetical protein